LLKEQAELLLRNVLDKFGLVRFYALRVVIQLPAMAKKKSKRTCTIIVATIPGERVVGDGCKGSEA
jgi:hypothetical protein